MITAAELAQINMRYSQSRETRDDHRRLISEVSRLNIELIREREKSEELRALLSAVAKFDPDRNSAAGLLRLIEQAKAKIGEL